MKEYRLRIEDELFKEIKVLAVESDGTINHVITEIIKDWIHSRDARSEKDINSS